MDILLLINVSIIALKMGYTKCNVKHVFGFILDKLGETFISNFKLDLLEIYWEKSHKEHMYHFVMFISGLVIMKLLSHIMCNKEVIP